SPLRNVAIATAWSAFTAATALSSIARASWGEPPCCANAAVESARADTAPIIRVRNIGILSFWLGRRKWFAGCLAIHFPVLPGLVILRQTFVLRCQSQKSFRSCDIRHKLFYASGLV